LEKQLRIIKPKTRPIQIEPWFFRYLNEGQLKVVSAILSHADIKDRQNNSFPSNRTIAFYCGFGLITPGTKAEENYNSLDSEIEKDLFKSKRLKNAISTVKNIKKDLEDKGLLKREYVGTNGKQTVYYTLDLNWKKEQYLKEFDEHFNDKEIIEDSEQDENITKELEQIKELHSEGNISKTNLADRLKNLSYKIKANDYNENSFIPFEDIDKVANFYMTTNKIKNKIEIGEIGNIPGYKQGIINSIKNNEFSLAEKIYKKLEAEEQKDNIETLTAAHENLDPLKSYQHKYYKFKRIKFTDNIYLAEYENDDQLKKDWPVEEDYIRSQLLPPHAYTRNNKSIIENYAENIKKFTEKMKGAFKKYE
jgi:DNA-binding Lrp family transcriptional regulator